MDDALVPYALGETKVVFISVLILVVMDDALVPSLRKRSPKIYQVLILVVMDDALVLVKFGSVVNVRVVLILVVMDDALVHPGQTFHTTGMVISLNPCCNG